MSEIKNYVIGAHRRVKDPKWDFKNTEEEGDIYEIYKAMYQASRASLRKFLQDDWIELCYTEPVDHINQAARIGWQSNYELWHSEPCNILIVGPDVSMIRPTKIFGRFNEFRMFNWTDPKTYNEPNPWNIVHQDYFNGDLVYIPHTTTKNVWRIFESMMVQYRDSTWGDDQVITNTMFWSQNIPWEEAHRPDLFYSAQWLPWQPIREMDEWNCYKIRNCHMIHWHGSRHSPTKLQMMQQINHNNNVGPYQGILN